MQIWVVARPHRPDRARVHDPDPCSITYQGRAMNRVEESRWPGLESTLYVLCYPLIFLL
jgi:hypothetical protein